MKGEKMDKIVNNEIVEQVKKKVKRQVSKESNARGRIFI